MAQHLLHKLIGTKLTHALVTPGRHSDGGGLVLQVQHGKPLKDGTTPLRAYWVFQYTRKGKAKYICLGSARDVHVKKARKTAAELRELKNSGECPVTERKKAQAKAAISLWDVVEEFYAAKTTHMGEQGREDWLAIMTREVKPALGDTPVASIKRPDIFGLVLPLWTERNATALKVLSHCRSVFEFATNAGKYEGENPAAIKPAAFPELNKETISHASLPFAQLPDFIGQLDVLASRNERYWLRAQMIKFVIFTAARVGPVEKMRWNEVDLDAKLWKAPSENMKLKPKDRRKYKGKCWHYPLSDAAVELLRGLPRGGDDDLVFAGTSQGNLKHVYTLLDARGVDGRIIDTHGFRTTAKTWTLKSCLPQVAKGIIQHTVSETKADGAYDGEWGVLLLEERAEALQRYADFATGRTPAGNVVPLRAAA